ncbi:MAG: RNA-binding domain-containing protein [Halobacteriota archaeon]
MSEKLSELVKRGESEEVEFKKISQKIRQRIKPETSPGIKVLEIEKKRIIEVKIKEGDNKPYYLDGIAYKRVGTENVVVPPEELERIILEKRKRYFDSEICERAGLEDIDEEKVKWFLKVAKVGRDYPLDENISVRDALAHLELLKEGKLTNVAVVLFGKNPQKFFLQSEVKCLHFHGTEVEKPFETYHIYRNTIFDQMDNSLGFVLDRLRRYVIPEPGKSTTKRPYEIPEFVIREAIVNAVAHRDYYSNAGIQVMVFVDRIEIWNPGELPKQLKYEFKLRKNYAKITQKEE